MNRILVVFVLAAPLALAAEPAAMAGGGCCGGDAGAAETTRDAAVHGGQLHADGDYRIETVMHQREIRLYLFGAKGQPLKTRAIEARGWLLRPSGEKETVTFKRLLAGSGRTQECFTATADLRYEEDAGQVLSVELKGLGEEGKGSATFKVPVRASDTVLYRCPMHPAVKAEDPGKCPDCGMALRRSVTAAEKSSGRTEGAAYTCPMHPDVQAKAEGSCPRCGMKLVPVAKEKKAAAYTCPMHPDVKASKPGKCPQCGMNLTKAAAEEKTAPAEKVFTCPMHPEVTAKKPGDCPKCGMKLREKVAREEGPRESPDRPGRGN